MNLPATEVWLTLVLPFQTVENKLTVIGYNTYDFEERTTATKRGNVYYKPLWLTYSMASAGRGRGDGRHGQGSL